MARERKSTLRVVILGDEKSGVRAFRNLGKEAKAAEDKVTRSAKGISGAMSGVKGGATSGFRNFAEAGLQGSVNPLTSFQSAALAQFGGAEKLLSGVSTKALAVGAGLTVAGVAAAKFGQVSVRNFTAAADAVDSFQDVTGASAEESSKMVFVADRLGVSSEQLAGSMFKLAKGANENRDKLRGFGVELARNRDGSLNLTETLANVADAYAGMTDPARKAELVQLAFGRGGAEMIDILEQQADGIRALSDEASRKAPILSQKDVDAGIEFNRQMKELDLAWKRITVHVGAGLVPALTDAARLATDMTTALEKGASKLPGGGGLLDKAKQIVPWVGPPLGIKLAISGLQSLADRGDDTAGTMARKFAPAAFRAGTGAGWLGARASAASGAVRGLGFAAQAAGTMVSRAAEAFAGFQSVTEDIRHVREVSNGYADALSSLDDLHKQVADSGVAYARAVESSNESVMSAEEALNDAYRGVAEAQAGVAKARSDAAEQIQRAEEDLAKASQEYAEAQQDAAEDVAEAEEDAAKRIVDAQKRIIDIRARADRQMRDAAQRLADARQDAADALSDAVGDDPFAAQRRREEAIRDLQRAEQDYGDTATDVRQDVVDAEEDYAETQKDAAKSVADAHEQAAETIASALERVNQAQRGVVEAQQSAAESIGSAQASVADANRGAASASRDLERAMRDAARAQDDAAASAAAAAPSVSDVDQKMQGLVDSTFKEVFQMRQLGASSQETQPKIEEAKEAIRRTGEMLGWSKDQTDLYIRQLDLIPSQVNTWVVLQMDARQFMAQMQQASLAYDNFISRSYIAAGIIEVVGGAQAVPVFTRDSGGPLPPGLSAVYNGTGSTEWVVTPEQMESMGGTTVVVQGSVISDRDLMDIIARAQRRGYG